MMNTRLRVGEICEIARIKLVKPHLRDLGDVADQDRRLAREQEGHHGTARVCGHRPPCPPATAQDHDAARLIAYHPEQGWGLLCNGVIVFDDTGELLPDGHSIPIRNDKFEPAAA
jgi:hypothetical protein